jgi:hypothetical protein
MHAISHTSRARKIIVGLTAASTLVLGVAATSTQAAAWHHHRGMGWGAPVAAGVIGGLALGAMATTSRPVVYSDCWIERRPVYNDRGRFLGHRRIRVCD